MKIAIFYHAKVSGGTPHIPPRVGQNLFQHQMDILIASELYEATHELVIGLNHDESVLPLVKDLVPDGAQIVLHGTNADSLLPTFKVMEDWVASHPGWLVCFFHLKGITHYDDPLNHAWRRCMEGGVIWKWKECVNLLQQGYDSVGCHWLTPQRFPGMVDKPFWGGCFWWCTSDFLAKCEKLAVVQPRNRDDWFIPEHYIGNGPPPKIYDWHSDWPGLAGCQQSHIAFDSERSKA